VEWNGGMEWWNGMVEWNSGMDCMTGVSYPGSKFIQCTTSLAGQPSSQQCMQTHIA